jgi:[CysO sulfur-carrier protein]-S-L-cysteine hydrolase
MSRRLVLPPELRQRIIDHALAECPNECVGLLAGHGDVVERVSPLINEANSPTHFFAAESLFAPMRTMRDAGLDLVAIYHSHPTSPPHPSRRDMEENYYPDTVHLIVSLLHDEPMMKAWLLSPDDAQEVEMISLIEA